MQRTVYGTVVVETTTGARYELGIYYRPCDDWRRRCVAARKAAQNIIDETIARVLALDGNAA